MVRSSVSVCDANLAIADALLKEQLQKWFIPIISLVFFHMGPAGAY